MTIKLEREFNTQPSKLFAAIKEGVLFESCGFDHDSLEIDFRVGGKYSLLYEKKHEVKGEFLEIIPNQKVVFTWSEENTKVTILIEPKGKASLLKLTHELIPDEKWSERFNGGWTFGFNNLTKKLAT